MRNVDPRSPESQRALIAGEDLAAKAYENHREMAGRVHAEFVGIWELGDEKTQAGLRVAVRPLHCESGGNVLARTAVSLAEQDGDVLKHHNEVVITTRTRGPFTQGDSCFLEIQTVATSLVSDKDSGVLQKMTLDEKTMRVDVQ